MAKTYSEFSKIKTETDDMILEVDGEKVVITLKDVERKIEMTRLQLNTLACILHPDW